MIEVDHSDSASGSGSSRPSAATMVTVFVIFVFACAITILFGAVVNNAIASMVVQIVMSLVALVAWRAALQATKTPGTDEPLDNFSNPLEISAGARNGLSRHHLLEKEVDRMKLAVREMRGQWEMNAFEYRLRTTKNFESSIASTPTTATLTCPEPTGVLKDWARTANGRKSGIALSASGLWYFWYALTDSLVDKRGFESMLSHPNIVAHHSRKLMQVECVPPVENVIVAEYHAITLQRLVAEVGRLPEVIQRRYVRQVVCGLEHLHGNNIAHRDLDLGSIFVTGSGDAKLGALHAATWSSTISPENVERDIQGLGRAVTESSSEPMSTVLASFIELCSAPGTTCHQLMQHPFIAFSKSEPSRRLGAFDSTSSMRDTNSMRATPPMGPRPEAGQTQSAHGRQASIETMSTMSLGDPGQTIECSGRTVQLALIWLSTIREVAPLQYYLTFAEKNQYPASNDERGYLNDLPESTTSDTN